ncbi:MAG: tripartite tricarboxylate transporter substrate-binding protein, partial [Betaproteobacteria bacterium]
THMGMELLRFSGIRMTHIPYKGAAPALVDLVGGHVQLMQTSIIIAKPYMSSMRLRPIAVTTAQRAKNLPQVPSIAETIPGYEVLNWWGVVAPAKTPPAVVNRLNTEIRQVMNRASSKEKLSVEGAESANGSPVEFEQMLKKEISQWRRLGESIQLKLD